MLMPCENVTSERSRFRFPHIGMCRWTRGLPQGSYAQRVRPTAPCSQHGLQLYSFNVSRAQVKLLFHITERPSIYITAVKQQTFQFSYFRIPMSSTKQSAKRDVLILCVSFFLFFQFLKTYFRIQSHGRNWRWEKLCMYVEHE